MKTTTTTTTYTVQEQAAYERGLREGRGAYRRGLSYDVPGFEPAGDQGYCDGWTAGADETEAKYGRAFACELSWCTGGVAAFEK